MPDDPDKLVTLQEYAEAQSAAFRQAREKFKYADDECTHARGHVTQQVFACVTCAKAAGERVGVCYSCSLQCHADHELIELDVRLGFCCDCPTAAVRAPCRFSDAAVKAPRNSANPYNHNFEGEYCLCCRRVASESDLDGTMILCHVCQDWFHPACLDAANAGAIEQFVTDGMHELVCGACVSQRPRLALYALVFPGEFQLVPSAQPVNVEAVNIETVGSCLLEDAFDELPKVTSVPRQLLFRQAAPFCKCATCKRDAASLNYSHLLEPFPEYEYTLDATLARQPEQPDEILERVLARIDRPTAVSAVEAYSDLKRRLVAFLQARAAEPGAAVTRADVEAFIASLPAARERWRSRLAARGSLS